MLAVLCRSWAVHTCSRIYLLATPDHGYSKIFSVELRLQNLTLPKLNDRQPYIEYGAGLPALGEGDSAGDDTSPSARATPLQIVMTAEIAPPPLSTQHLTFVQLASSLNPTLLHLAPLTLAEAA